jgi:hypothetical protein
MIIKNKESVSYDVIETALSVMAERRKALEAAPDDAVAKRGLLTAIDNVNGLLERMRERGERVDEEPFSWEHENSI